MASRIETLPVEVINHILSYLVHPRSRLPGRSERLSDFQCPKEVQRAAKAAYFLNSSAPPDVDRFGADRFFGWRSLPHPFNALALTSRYFRGLVEKFCGHLVRGDNRFNLPFANLERDGPGSVYPDLSHIVFRRLWLQLAPRFCIFCAIPLSVYPHKWTGNLMMMCAECFYDQVLTFQEIESHFHLSRMDLQRYNVCASKGGDWARRDEVEAVALKLYGTRKFHNVRKYFGAPRICSVCVDAGTLRRAAVFWSEREAASGWITDSAGWIAHPKSDSTSSQSSYGNKWPRLLQYRLDPNQYEQKVTTSTETRWETYIGHHLTFESLKGP
ncbi:hypothetical protein CC78DRAFT_580255 [Lojkania enalia]|uniref:Uncharacterized protein n=1 Tax=Lojkania enalia TaxID=147567 RepID=A0A9P4K800_9PLEO|nr:hypothetical protein CC78DRAFT_580255 [Didymosphaeria enalia]